METSEFGKGFIYNLVLFAAHFERPIHLGDYSMWFNAASDHLYEFEVPEKWKGTKVGEKAEKLKELSLDIGHGSRLTDHDCKSDFELVKNLTKEIALLIDQELGHNPVKAEYE